MKLRQRLENLPVGRKLLLALLLLLAAVLLVSNLTFISAAYWISRQSVAPQAMHTLGELFATEELSSRALSSPEAASELLRRLDGYALLRAAVIYDRDGNSLRSCSRVSGCGCRSGSTRSLTGVLAKSAPTCWSGYRKRTAAPGIC